MASPVVAATNKSSTNTAGTSHTVNLPSGIAAGDLLIVCLDKGSTSATVNALAGWTELLDEASANGLYIAYRKADGSEGSTITLTTSANTRSAEISFRITGAEDPATQAPQIGTTGTGTSATPDPPASAAPGSSKDYLFIAFAGMAGEEADDDTWGNTPPTNYTPNPPLQKSCGTAGTNLGGLIVAAHRQLTTGVAENPGTFGVDTSAAWRSQTIMVHPRAVATVERSAAIDAAGAIASSGTFFSVFTASAAADAAGAIATSGQVVKDRSAAVSASGAIASVPQRDLLRSAAVDAAASPAVSAFQRELFRQVGVSATGGIASTATFFSIFSRSVALDGAGGIASVPQRDLLRQLVLGAAADINATGAIDGGFVTHNRSASLDAAGGIASQAIFWTTFERALAVEATGAVSAVGLKLLVRAVALNAAADISAAPQRLVLRSLAVSALAEITAVGASAIDWTYGPYTDWSYSGQAGFAYTGGSASTYNIDPGWSYDGGD